MGVLRPHYYKFLKVIEEFLKEFPTFYDNKLSTLDICKELEDKALSHSRYDVIPDSFTKRRPNETEAAHDYAVQNYRRITHELLESWLTKAGRVFNSSSFYISGSSEELKERLSEDKKLFEVNNMSLDWKGYVRHFIYPASLVNPNQLFHFFPINYDFPTEPPYESLPENEAVGLLPILINYNLIKFAHSNLFIFQHPTETKIVEINNEKINVPVCYAMDEQYWFQLYPVKDSDAEKGYKYLSRKWYTHDFNEVPFLWLPGKYQKNEKGDIYLKSTLSASFEHLDEFIGLFKDSQAITTQHAYPHMYMLDIDCPECDGTGVDLEGNTCHVCDGMKVMKKPDPTQVLRVPRTNKMVDGDIIDPVMGWLYPGVDIMAHLDEKTKQTFRNAFLSVGLRSFLDVSESGEAKKHRLEDMIDRLEDSADMVKVFSESMLMILEKYIKYGSGSREIEDVAVTKPKAFHALNKNELAALMNEANGELKKEIYRYSFLEANGGTPENQKIADIIFLYAPLVASDINEKASYINLSVYDNTDAIRAEHAVSVLTEISKEKGFLTWEFNQIATAADLKLNEWGLLNLSLLNAAQDLGTGNEKKIAGTVGGVQGIIGISSAVANGEMTERAAENLLITVYGYSPEQASKLIDVPSGKIEKELNE